MESFISFSLELFLRIYDVQIEIYGKRTVVPVRSFHSVRRGREYRIWADSFQMHFWFVWFPGRYIENENVTTVYPLTLLLRKKTRNFFLSLKKGTVISLYYARSPLSFLHAYIHTHTHILLLITDCIWLEVSMTASPLCSSLFRRWVCVQGCFLVDSTLSPAIYSMNSLLFSD